MVSTAETGCHLKGVQAPRASLSPHRNKKAAGTVAIVRERKIAALGPLLSHGILDQEMGSKHRACKEDAAERRVVPRVVDDGDVGDLGSRVRIVIL